MARIGIVRLSHAGEKVPLRTRIPDFGYIIERVAGSDIRRFPLQRLQSVGLATPGMIPIPTLPRRPWGASGRGLANARNRQDRAAAAGALFPYARLVALAA